AADVRREHTHARLRELEGRRERAPHDPGRLRRGPDGERLTVPVGDEPAGLERRCGEASVRARLADDDGCGGKYALDVAAAQLAAEQHGFRAERLFETHTRIAC